MRYKNILFAVVLGVILPWLLLMTVEPVERNDVNTYAQTTGSAGTEVELPVLLEDGCVRIMTMTDYLQGVLMGEMPASFEMEALKAQAVAARTFTVKSMTLSKHPNAAVCTSPRCCQAYLTQEQYAQKGGRQQDVLRLRRAVEETDGQVLYYDGELIVASYFSCSGGRTEDAVAVWGVDVPYLQAVDSPGEENATHYMDTVQFSASEFERLLDTDLSRGIGDYSYSDGGGVDSVRVGDKEFTGTQLRQLLGLRSTAFTINISGATVEITTKGFGHRVGMSQYGANAMAAEGRNYTEILQYYYIGAELGHMEEMMV